MIRLIALLLTVMTGFSGLVYEVAWQKYLATLLGSHSEATASVLAIFLGGLSVGYWLFGQVTRRHVVRSEEAGVPPRLLLIYGSLEAGIGVYVIAFPWLFRAVQALSYALPHGTGGVGFAIDVALATLLIGPASVLMGGTIPILTQGLARSLEDATRFHAFVYAFNTAGAFVGALAAGFYLIPALGLVNVMLAMGCINLVAGGIFIALGVRGREVVSLATETAGEGAKLEGFATYAFVSLLSGFAMMTIQTAVIRIAGLSFGSSQFTFSMVVAVFVLCIALGSFAVSALGRIPTWLIVGNQWLLAALFLALYPKLDEMPHWIWLLRLIFRDIDAAFLVYYLAGFVGILVLLGLPVILSGAVLPLLFHQMRTQVDHLGDLAGSLYSWNTVGSLLGALLGGYAFFYWFDLHEIMRIAILALLAAALLLTLQIYALQKVWAGLLVPLVLLVMLLPSWDPTLLYAGLFRRREVMPFAFDGIDSIREQKPKWFADNIIYAEDDPITSVTVRRYQYGEIESLSISTNGKSDGDTYVDYTTMGMAAVLPALLADQARSAFVIGWGTGVTAGELAAMKSIERVDVAEISPGVMNAAPLFDFANMNASTHSKIDVIESDAYRALMRSEVDYDLVISEPSNPWVAGVEMLFSKEFLEAAKAKLTEGGVYCQWFHQYETDSETVALVMRTYREVFDHVAVWRANSYDLLIMGFNKPGPALDHYRLEARAEQPDLKAALMRSRVGSFPALLAHEVLPLGVLHAADLPGPIHTLYHPILSDEAGRAFFRGARGQLPFTGYGEPARLGHANSMTRAWMERHAEGPSAEARADYASQRCALSREGCRPLVEHWLEETPNDRRLRHLLDDLVNDEHTQWPDDGGVARHLFGDGSEIVAAGRLRPDQAFRLTETYMQAYSHGMPFSPRALESVWSSCSRRHRDQTQCERDLLRAQSEGAASFTDEELDAAVDRCVAEKPNARVCIDGRVQIGDLLERGIVPAALEEWREFESHAAAR